MRWTTRKLPDSFLSAETLFEPESSYGKSHIEMWKFGITTRTRCVMLGLLAFALQWWWALPILAFIGLMAGGLADQIEAKAAKGYPYLEHTNAMGMGFAGMFFGVICLVAFVISFSIPSPGWINMWPL